MAGYDPQYQQGPPQQTYQQPPPQQPQGTVVVQRTNGRLGHYPAAMQCPYCNANTIRGMLWRRTRMAIGLRDWVLLWVFVFVFYSVLYSGFERHCAHLSELSKYCWEPVEIGIRIDLIKL